MKETRQRCVAPLPRRSFSVTSVRSAGARNLGPSQIIAKHYMRRLGSPPHWPCWYVNTTDSRYEHSIPRGSSARTRVCDRGWNRALLLLSALVHAPIRRSMNAHISASGFFIVASECRHRFFVLRVPGHGTVPKNHADPMAPKTESGLDSTLLPYVHVCHIPRRHTVSKSSQRL